MPAPPCPDAVDAVTLFDMMLPVLQGTASCLDALSVALAQDSVSGPRAAYAVALLAQQLDRAVTLLRRWEAATMPFHGQSAHSIAKKDTNSP